MPLEITRVGRTKIGAIVDLGRIDSKAIEVEVQVSTVVADQSSRTGGIFTRGTAVSSGECPF